MGTFWRRRRDLNPRAAINDLLPFQGSPFSLLGISPKRPKNNIHELSNFVQYFFSFFNYSTSLDLLRNFLSIHYSINIIALFPKGYKVICIQLSF